MIPRYRLVRAAGGTNDIDLHLARVEADVMDVLERNGAIDIVDTDRIHDDIAAAVDEHERLHPTT